MNEVSSPGPPATPPGGTKPTARALFFQIAALVIAVPALLWGGGCVWDLVTTAAPGDIENSILVLGTWVVNLPLGLAILAIGLFVRKGSRTLRWLCIATSLVVLTLPIVVNQLFSKAREIKEETEVILPEGGMLTSKPLTLTAKTNSENSPLLFAGSRVAHPPVSMLEIYTGPITYAADFSVNMYMNTENATSIKDSNFLGNFSLPADDRRQDAAGQGDRTIPFPMITGASLYKLVQPGKPFSVILVPVGSAATDPNFQIPVRRIELRALGGSWEYRFLRSRAK